MPSESAYVGKIRNDYSFPSKKRMKLGGFQHSIQVTEEKASAEEFEINSNIDSDTFLILNFYSSFSKII